MFRLADLNGFECVLRGAVAADRAVGGALFTGADHGHALQLESFLGLDPPMVDFVKSITPGDGSAVGNAVSNRHRVVIRDLEQDAAGEFTGVALEAGVRAVNAAPLIDSQLRSVGALALYYDHPHHPTYEALHKIDRCCRIAAQLIEINALADRINQADAKAGNRERFLSPAGKQAADNVRLLLPVCNRSGGDEVLLGTIARHLDHILVELNGFLRIHRYGGAATE